MKTCLDVIRKKDGTLISHDKEILTGVESHFGAVFKAKYEEKNDEEMLNEEGLRIRARRRV